MTAHSSNGNGLWKRCSAATNNREVWFAVGITCLILGFMRPSGAFIALGAAFLAVGAARRRRILNSE
jgi:hypothetical protein